MLVASPANVALAISLVVKPSAAVFAEDDPGEQMDILMRSAAYIGIFRRTSTVGFNQLLHRIEYVPRNNRFVCVFDHNEVYLRLFPTRLVRHADGRFPTLHHIARVMRIFENLPDG
ncbi:hypothetical protein D3C74_362190 [compost metagenome]